ncbi:MAG: diguanylate cyclase [Ignavibacteriales bacterium]|nr:diguanylate cyclase [Ignavibacteriales bacterium]
MPDNQQEIARFHTMKDFMEEGILAGVGVLLVFLGVFSKVPLTNIVAVGIGAFLFYVTVELYREKNPKRRDLVEGNDDDDSPTVDPKLPEEYFEPKERETDQFIEHREIYKSERPEHKFQASDFVEERPKPTMSTMEPQSEFNNLLIKVLTALKDVCFAHTVAFFWVNHESKQLVLEAKITDSGSFTTDRKVMLSEDVVSSIGLTGEPKIVNNILAETEQNILCYYKSLQDVKSFIGVPVFYASDAAKSKTIGVIAVDSKAEDAYGDETFSVLSHFSKLISALLISYTEKYDLFADVKLVEADWKLKRKISNKPSIPFVVNGLTEELENIISWDSVVVVLFDEAQRGWSLASVRVRSSEKFVSPKQLIDFENSIVGKAIRTNTVQSMHLAENSQVVFNAGENSFDLLKHGELIVAPFSSDGKCYGAVVVTNKKPNAFSKKDVFAVEYLASTVAPAFETAELGSILNEHLAVDEQTGTWSKKFFLRRLSEELQRANDRGEDLTMVLVTLSNVSDIEQRYGVEGKDAALVNVANHLRANVRPYDVVARFDAVSFAIVLADTIASDAYLWAEKLRTSIASSIVTVERRSFSISVTIGVSGAAAKMTPDDLIKNTSLVLDQAKKAGGNIVRVF